MTKAKSSVVPKRLQNYKGEPIEPPSPPPSNNGNCKALKKAVNQILYSGPGNFEEKVKEIKALTKGWECVS